MSENGTSQVKADSPHYFEIPPELRRILDAHRVWLNTGGKEGSRAVLLHYPFQGLNLHGENLERADLPGANFQRANLADANLKQAQLQGATFYQADLTGTDFRDADLARADLGDSKGLAALLLARANLTSCRLPEDQAKFAGLDYVKDASSVTSNLFMAMLIACVYTGITVFTTSDVALLTNTGITTLPLLGVGISVASFYFAAPLLLLAIYIYFHLNLQHLWESLATLPGIFPDGQQLDQKVYPWLLNWLPSSYFIRLQELKNHRFIMEHLQKYLAVFFAWYFLPLTLILLGARYLYVRNFYVTHYHLVIIALAAWFGFRFSYYAGTTLRGENGKKSGRAVWNAILTGLVLLVLYVFADGFIGGFPAKLEPELRPEIGWFQHRKLVPEVFDYLRLKIVVNFEEKDVSTRFTRGDGRKGEPRSDKDGFLARGAPLQGRNLRYAWAKGAFMARADLRRANLEGAYLSDADLREAKLGETGYPPADPDYRVKLEKAFLYKANLTNACLYKANMHQATLEEAILTGCNLESAVLTDANLRSANFREAILKGIITKEANFQEATLDGANLLLADFQGARGLKEEQLKSGKNWSLAFYDAEMLLRLNLPPDHNPRVLKHRFSGYDLREVIFKNVVLSGADFKGADLRKADLSSTDLRGADLQGADLTGASLEKADLEGANLMGARIYGTVFHGANLAGADLSRVRGFNRSQFKDTKTDDQTKLP